MRAGQLRHRIEIQRPSVTRDATGAEIKAWSALVALWAHVQTLNGSERILQTQANATLTHTIVIRNYAGISPVMRVRWDGRLFEIHSVVADERDQQMTLLCTELVSYTGEIVSLWTVGRSRVGGLDTIAGPGPWTVGSTVIGSDKQIG
jgi:SPP1 family predicted phage head-tail adaptor